MAPASTQAPHRVVIAGGGVAGLEALLALRALAGEYVALTLIEPGETFALRALSVQDPFAPAPTLQYDLQRICTEQQATLVPDRLESVDVDGRVVRTASGREEPFDSLLLALGARPAPVYPQATTFRGASDAEGMQALLRGIEQGKVKSVAFVVPAGITWTLPLYELALMTAERSRALGTDGLTLTIVTPEESALHVFGRDASAGVAAALANAGVDLLARAYTEAVGEDGLVVLHTRLGEDSLVADRVVALPRLDGPAPPGVPVDGAGFLSTDQHGHVRSVEGVFAAGDGTDFAVKQGGLAAQQADAAAHAIAARAGVEVDPLPFRPVLRGRLFTGSGSHYLREVLTGGEGEDTSRIEPHALWWPASKVAAPYLAPYLERLDLREEGFTPAQPPADGGDVEVLGRFPAPQRVGRSDTGGTQPRHFARELPRERWHEEADRLSLERLHARTLVEVQGADVGAGIEPRGLLLLAMGYDARDDVFEVAVARPQPDGEEVFRHLVDHPARILVDSAEGILPEAVAVDDGDGNRTLVHLLADAAFSG